MKIIFRSKERTITGARLTDQVKVHHPGTTTDLERRGSAKKATRIYSKRVCRTATRLFSIRTRQDDGNIGCVILGPLTRPRTTRLSQVHQVVPYYILSLSINIVGHRCKPISATVNVPHIYT